MREDRINRQISRQKKKRTCRCCGELSIQRIPVIRGVTREGSRVKVSEKERKMGGSDGKNDV